MRRFCVGLLVLLPGPLVTCAAWAETAPPPGVADAASQPGSSTDAASSSNAARSRLRECGHQWSTMKKTGAANGMTWKDYSRSCLAKQ